MIIYHQLYITHIYTQDDIYIKYTAPADVARNSLNLINLFVLRGWLGIKSVDVSNKICSTTVAKRLHKLNSVWISKLGNCFEFFF